VLLLTVKGREASFAVVSMTVGPRLRMRDIERSCGIPSLPYSHPSKKKKKERKEKKKRKKKQSRQKAVEEN